MKSQKTGGRKKGTPNRKSVAHQQAVAEVQVIAERVLGAEVAEAFTGNAHALLVMIYKDPTQHMVLRLDAAKAAIGYEQPKLAAIEHSGNIQRSDVSEKPLSNEEWDRQYGDRLETPVGPPESTH